MGCWSWRFPLGGKSFVQVQIKPGGGSCHYSWGFLFIVAASIVATALVTATLIVDALLVVTLIATDPIGVWLATLHLALDQPQSRAVFESTNSTFVEIFFMKNLKFVQCHLVCFSLFEVAAGSIIAHYPRIKPNTSLFFDFSVSSDTLGLDLMEKYSQSERKSMNQHVFYGT